MSIPTQHCVEKYPESVLMSVWFMSFRLQLTSMMIDMLKDVSKINLKAVTAELSTTVATAITWYILITLLECIVLGHPHVWEMFVQNMQH